MSRVSIIIPNFNCAQWVEATVNSCMMEADMVSEIIVVDDFSDDNSIEILADLSNRYRDKIIVIANELKGANNARNLGYSFAKGEFIQWLDADDSILNGKLKAQVRFFDSNPEVDIVYSDWSLLTLTEDGKVIKKEDKKNHNYRDMIEALLEDKWSAQHVYLLRRKIADKLNKIAAWNPETRIAQDREYYTLAALLGAKFQYVPGTFAQYNRWSKNSVSSANRSLRWNNLWKIFERFEGLINELQFAKQPLLNRYLNLLYTNRLLCVVMDSSLKIELYKKPIYRIQWRMIHGFRTKLKVLRLFISHKKNHSITKIKKQYAEN